MGTNNYNVGIVVAEVCRVGDRERLEGVWNASALGRQGLNQEKPWTLYKGVQILFCHKYKETLKNFDVENDIKIFMLGKMNWKGL